MISRVSRGKVLDYILRNYYVITIIIILILIIIIIKYKFQTHYAHLAVNELVSIPAYKLIL